MAKTSLEMAGKKSKVRQFIDAIFGDSEKKERVNAKMSSDTPSGGSYRYLGSISYTGEKNQGEMGPVKSYVLDYEALRARSWALLLESEIAQIVIGKYIIWLHGAGLKLQSEPAKLVLESEGISIDSESFSKDLEARFSLYKGSKIADYANMNTLNEIEATADKNALAGGDVLVILRVIDNHVKVELIDGRHVQSPMYGSDWYPYAMKNGNRIIHGVEVAPNGEHVAFYVRRTTAKGEASFEFDRVPARGKKTGLVMAYLYYGLHYRIDNHRGMPLLSVVMENIAQLDRYKSATVGSAEERQKIPYTIEHPYPHSTGENPLLGETAIALSGGETGDDVPIDDLGNQLEKRVAATTKKNVYNLPIGAIMKAIDSKNELYFKDFYETNIMLITASVYMPVDVAMSKYNDSFSASRAALKDWENTLLTKRAKFSQEFLQPILNLFLHVQILLGKVKAKGYIEAFNSGDEFILEAFRKARFVGVQVPHIDPEKEVKAERLKMGTSGAHIPLTTSEAATEALNGGDFDSNLQQYSKELEETESLKIKVQPPPLDPNTVVKANSKSDKKKKEGE